jgi:hypothetical protein
LFVIVIVVGLAIPPPPSREGKVKRKHVKGQAESSFSLIITTQLTPFSLSSHLPRIVQNHTFFVQVFATGVVSFLAGLLNLGSLSRSQA